MSDSLGNRKHKRSKNQLPIIIDGKEGSTLNIGLGGALVLVDHPLPVLEDIVVVIKISERTVKVSGTCLRCEDQGKNYKAAIFFDDSSFQLKEKELLKAYLDEERPNLGFLT